MKLTLDFKKNVRTELLSRRKLFMGSDKAYAQSLDINSSAYSRIKKGEYEGVIAEEKWLTIGRELDVMPSKSPWKLVKTSVYIQFEEMINECRMKHLSKLVVDDNGIGKSECCRDIAKRLPNAFYIDCSNYKTKIEFIRNLAKKIGLDSRQKTAEVLRNVKYYINLMENPVFILDEFGDVAYSTFMLVKELWNATEGNAGWLMTGAEGLRNKINKGIGAKKVGYAELFSRFTGDYYGVIPIAKEQKDAFWMKLFHQICQANLAREHQAKLKKIVRKSMSLTSDENRRDIRFLKDLMKTENLIAHG